MARAKDVDEVIGEFRKLDESRHIEKPRNQQPKHIIVKGGAQLLKKLEDGYSLVQSLDEDKFLMKLLS